MSPERLRIMNGFMYTIEVPATKDTRATKLFMNATGTREVFDNMVKEKLPMERILNAIVIHHEHGVKPISELKRVN